MKTKIVYCVSSDNSDFYLEQALLSAYSVKRYNSEAKILLVVDQRTNATIHGQRETIRNYIDEIVVVNIPSEFNKAQTSRYLKTSLRKHVSGDILFLDTDTIVADKIDDIDHIDFKIGAVIDNHVPVSQHENCGKDEKKWARNVGWICTDDIPYYNSGVMFVKDCEETHKLYDKWHSNWRNQLAKFSRHQDQAVLALSNEQCGYVIQELHGTWNCQILEYGLPYIHEAKIIHYFYSHGIYKYKPTMAYAFQRLEIFKEIRATGTVSKEMEEYISNARHAFINPSRIVCGRELVLLSSDVAYVCLHHPFFLPFFNFMAQPFLFGRRMAIKIWKLLK